MGIVQKIIAYETKFMTNYEICNIAHISSLKLSSRNKSQESPSFFSFFSVHHVYYNRRSTFFLIKLLIK